MDVLGRNPESRVLPTVPPSPVLRREAQLVDKPPPGKVRFKVCQMLTTEGFILMPAPSTAVRTARRSTARKATRRSVCILGATGSIGTNAINVCTHLKDQFEIHSLTACTSWKKLSEQSLEVRPKMVALNDKSSIAKPSENLRALRDQLLGTGIEMVVGPHAMEEIVVRDDVDIVVAAV